jgi:hypothetical protein
MLYEKTLNRKILGAKQEVKQEPTNGHSNGDSLEEGNGHTNGNHDTNKQPSDHLLKRIGSAMWSIFKKKPKTETKEEKDPASMGKILNLMRNDAYEIAQRFWEFSDIITKPAGAIFATLLIWRMLGWACLL